MKTLYSILVTLMIPAFVSCSEENVTPSDYTVVTLPPVRQDNSVIVLRGSILSTGPAFFRDHGFLVSSSSLSDVKDLNLATSGQKRISLKEKQGPGNFNYTDTLSTTTVAYYIRAYALTTDTLIFDEREQKVSN